MLVPGYNDTYVADYWLQHITACPHKIIAPPKNSPVVFVLSYHCLFHLLSLEYDSTPEDTRSHCDAVDNTTSLTGSYYVVGTTWNIGSRCFCCEIDKLRLEL